MSGCGAGPPEPRSSTDVETRIVDALESLPNLAHPSSRYLLVSRTEKSLGHRLAIADYPVRRQWFFGLVTACRDVPGGLKALASALAEVEPGSPVTESVEQCCAEWENLTDDGGFAGRPPSGPSARLVSRSARAAGMEARTADAEEDAPSPRAADGPARRADSLRHDEVIALARAFSSPIEARQVLLLAGVPAYRVPDWGVRDALQYWTEVNVLLDGGLLVDGRRRVLWAAGTLYPANPGVGRFPPLPE